MLENEPRGRARWVFVVLGLLVVFGVVLEIRASFERMLRHDLVRAIESAFHGRVTIDSVRLNPFLGTVTFRKIQVAFPMSSGPSPSGDFRPLFTFPEVDGHVSLFSLLNRVYDFEDLTFRNPLVTASFDDGRDNYRKFLEEWRHGNQFSGEGGAIVRSFRVTGARIEWGSGGQKPEAVLSGLEGSVDSNLLMNRFRTRFSSQRFMVRRENGTVTIDGISFRGVFEKGSLRDFKFSLSMKPSWFWVKGNVTRIQDAPFLDLFFHGRLELRGLSPLFGGTETSGETSMSGTIHTDGYVHGPADRWNGNLLVTGQDLTVSGKRYRSVSMKARFSPDRLHVDPLSMIRSQGETMTARVLADLSNAHPGARIRVSKTTHMPEGLGASPVQVTVARTIRLPRRSTTFGEWMELFERIMGPSLS